MYGFPLHSIISETFKILQAAFSNKSAQLSKCDIFPVQLARVFYKKLNDFSHMQQRIYFAEKCHTEYAFTHFEGSQIYWSN